MLPIVLAPINKRSYARRVLSVQPANLIRYWPLWEPAGTSGAGSVKDQSSLGGHATPSNVTFGVAGVGVRTAASFNDSSSNVNIYSAALNTAFNTGELTLACWLLVANWTAAAAKYAFNLGTGSHSVGIYQAATGQLSFIYNTTNVKQVAPTGLSYAGWFNAVLTISKSADRMRAYINGAQAGSDLTGLGAWSGALASVACAVGAAYSIPLNVWNGRIAHAAIWTKELTAAEVAALAVV